MLRFAGRAIVALALLPAVLWDVATWPLRLLWRLLRLLWPFGPKAYRVYYEAEGEPQSVVVCRIHKRMFASLLTHTRVEPEPNTEEPCAMCAQGNETRGGPA
jgi:hypothetical protein